MDPRATKLAKIIIDYSLKIKKDDRVVLSISDLQNLDLAKECYRISLEKGAFVYLDVMGMNYEIGRADFGGFTEIFFNSAFEKVMDTPPAMLKAKIDWGNKFIRITSINNPKFLSAINPDRVQKWAKTYYPTFEEMINKDWLLTYFPTVGMAQNANMSLDQLIDFYYEAAIVDYVAMGKKQQKLQEVLDKGKQVRITGKGIDMKFGINGRLASAYDHVGTRNIPDGEIWVGPEEDITEGYVEFDWPQIYNGFEVAGIRLEYKKGRVLHFSSENNQNFFDKTLNDHVGNRCLGELGIGTNFNIKNQMKDILFDEKIGGTVHMALGKAYEEERGGGKNKGTIHWDMIKDLRHEGSKIEIDGVVIQKNGEFLL